MTTTTEVVVVVKRCNCCSKTFTAAQWAAVPTLGFLDMGPGEERIRLVNCACKSTIGLPEARS